MATRYEHLGVYSDWVAWTRQRRPARAGGPGSLLEMLGAAEPAGPPRDVEVVRRWEHDGLRGEEVRWSVGYGPRTRAVVLRPARAGGAALPGVLALHGHDGYKFYGLEKISDGPEGPADGLAELRAGLYDGRAFANDLAAGGFTVLVHDVFGWGSRRFPYDELPALIRRLAETTEGVAPPDGSGGAVPAAIRRYNAAGWHHEHLVEKYCHLLGTTMAAVVSHEDRVALAYLAARPDVAADRLGCIGLSGGGCRSALLHATSDRIAAAVVVGMMSTHDALLDRNVISHTWMFFPAGAARFADWPDLAATRAPAPLLVQYDRDDELFPPDGMRGAHDLLAAAWRRAGRPEAYTGQFYDGPHKFDRDMQRAAYAWLHDHLDAG